MFVYGRGYSSDNVLIKIIKKDTVDNNKMDMNVK